MREQAVRALILVPTKELGQQVQAMIRQLTAYCVRDVRVANISGKAVLSAQRWVQWKECIDLGLKKVLKKGKWIKFALNIIV